MAFSNTNNVRCLRSLGYATTITQQQQHPLQMGTINIQTIPTKHGMMLEEEPARQFDWVVKGVDIISISFRFRAHFVRRKGVYITVPRIFDSLSPSARHENFYENSRDSAATRKRAVELFRVRVTLITSTDSGGTKRNEKH